MLTSPGSILATGGGLSLPVLVALWKYRNAPGRPAHRLAVHAGTVVAAAVTHLTLALTWPGSAVAWSVAVLFVGGWLVEVVGERTGFPFGRYRYGAFLCPRLLRVPLVVPVGYMVVVPTVWGVADRLTGGSRGADFVCVAALAATAWDLILDPLFVHWKAWTWTRPRGYFGIPWTNFAGWFAVTAALTVLVNPGPLAADPLVGVFTGSWVFGIATLLAHLPSRRPGIVGGVVVGGLVALSLNQA